MKSYVSDLENRPLTENEKFFSEKNYKLFLWYTRWRNLSEDEIDALVIPYLNTVKKYLSIPRLQQYKFTTILVKQMDAHRQRYYKSMYTQRHMPEGGICSLNYVISDNNEREKQIESLMYDRSVDIERDFIDREVFKEFWNVIETFPMGEQMKVVLNLLLKKYTEKETVDCICEEFPDWKFDRKQLNYILQQLHFAFKEAGLDAMFSKTSICKILYYDILEYAIKEKIIKRQGAKLIYNSKVIGKGRDEGKRYLMDNPAECEKIISELKNAGKIA